MRILHITPGAGDGTDCEACLRDHSLVWALRKAGHDVELITLYLPPRADRPEEATEAPIFYGGVNVYLQQISSVFRHTPRIVDRMFDWRPLLSWASRRSGMTQPADLGPTTLSMLQGEQGRQVKELERLIAHVSSLPPVDVVSLSNGLIAGMGPALREALGVPVACLLQDEDDFLDGLGDWAEQAWELFSERLRSLDGTISVSRWYADEMQRRCGLERVDVVHSAIHGADVPVSSGEKLCFLSPLLPVSGADRVLDVWEKLDPRPELLIVGIKKFDDEYVAGLQSRIAGKPARIVRAPEREERLALLGECAVMCAPTRRPQAFGRFVLEAQAAGVPVVLPAHGAFVELMEAMGGGVLVPPDDPDALQTAIAELLGDAERRQALGSKGREAVLEQFSLERFAAGVVSALESIVAETAKC